MYPSVAQCDNCVWNRGEVEIGHMKAARMVLGTQGFLCQEI